MSFQAICWAFNQKLERSSAKFVLVCLANYANESFEAYPSTETLSELTAMDRKTVIDRLDDLCITGLIRDTGRRVGLTKQVKVYQLNYQERLPKTEPSQKRNCSVFPSEGSQKRDTKGSQKRDTDPIREPVREPGGGKPPAKYIKEIRIQIEEAEQERTRLKNQHASVTATGTSWDSEPDRQTFLELGRKIKVWRQEIFSK